MGCYVNPKDCSKETWLKNNAECIYKPNTFPKWEDVAGGTVLPVVLVDNGPFTAAGVGYEEREYNDFILPDGRPKQVYKVSIERLKEVSPLDVYLEQQNEIY